MSKSDIPTFLDGAVSIAQGKGYRAGLDAVLLAASLQIKPGQRAIELGCGVGTALLCAAMRNAGANFTGIEKQMTLVSLANENIARNALGARVNVRCTTVSKIAKQMGCDQFDHVFFNPPYQDDAKNGNSPALGRDTAFVADEMQLSDWLAEAVQLVKTRGYITLIHRADKVAHILANLEGPCGDIHILPIAPRSGETAHRVLVRGRKGVRTPATLAAPLVLHGRQNRHTTRADAILRGTEALVF